MTDQAQEVRYEINFRIKDIPERHRPRELFDRQGAEGVSEETLIALVLRSGVKGVSVVNLARTLLEKHGSLTSLAQASVDELAGTQGMGKVKAQVLIASFELAKRLSAEQTTDRPVVKSPDQAADVLREIARTRRQESFWVLMLDTRCRLKRTPFEMTRGILDASLVHPREVFQEAVRTSSAAVILVHNHPSGDPTPSKEDIKITNQLVEAGNIMDIQVIDHIILGTHLQGGGADFFSLKESGLVKFK